jgi:hypothetical protein
MCGRLGDGGRRDEHRRDLPQGIASAPFRFGWMNGQGVVCGANAGVDPAAASHVIPQRHDLLM